MQLNGQISQGSAATDLRLGGSYRYSSLLNVTMRELFRLVYVCQSYSENESGIRVMTRCAVSGRSA